MSRSKKSTELVLWRHADAEEGYPDGARALTALGCEQADKMAHWLSRRLPSSFRLLVSPAVRAQQTARALSKSFDTVDDVGLNTTPARLLAAAGWEEEGGFTVVVGHQPTLGLVAGQLMNGEPGEWHVQKGAIVWFKRKSGVVRLRALLAPDLV